MTFIKALVESAKKLATVMSPQQALELQKYFDRIKAVINFVSGASKEKYALMQLATAYQDNVLQVIALLDGITISSLQYKSDLKMIDSFFQSGGFDSWTDA